MKTLIGLLAFMAALTAGAQATNAPAMTVTAARKSHLVPGQNRGGAGPAAITLQLPKPNALVKGKITYSGIAVEAVKTRRPLDRLSPFASSEYGVPEDNVVRDPVTGRVSGLKIFALSF